MIMRMPQPKARGRKWWLGLNIFTIPNRQDAGIGWAAIRLGTHRTYGNHREAFGDPADLAVLAWLAADEPRPPVELYRFPTEDDFRGSRAEREGMTLDQYRLQLIETTTRLRMAGAEVHIVSAKA